MLDLLPQILDHPSNTIFMFISKCPHCPFYLLFLEKYLLRKVSDKIKFIHAEVFDMITVVQSDFQYKVLQE